MAKKDVIRIPFPKPESSKRNDPFGPVPKKPAPKKPAPKKAR